MKLKKFFFKKVKSTNDTALRLINLGIKKGIVLAEYQSNGRGQRSNKWISKKGNLFTSVFFDISKKISLKKIINLNLIIIKSIVSKKIKSSISVKKPNDILIDKKKVCGILQETIFKNDKKFLIIGIGINIVSSPNIIDYKTTFLNYHSKKNVKRISLFNEIKLNFEKNLNYFKA